MSHEYAPFRGGVATYVQEIAGAAKQIGGEVAVWTVDRRAWWQGAKHPQADNVCTESVPAFPVVRFSSSGRLTPVGLLSFAWGAWRRRRETAGKSVVLASVGAQMAFFLLAAVGCRFGGKVTCLFHGSEVLRFQRNAVWRVLARRFYRKHATGFAATTRYVEGLLRESELLPEDATVLLVPCALPAVFHVEHVPQRTAADEEGFRVLTVARLHPRKGQLEVARALGRLPKELRERVTYQLVGVGEAAYRQAVEAACRSGGVRCEFLGALDDRALGETYARATVYAQASRTMARSVEGFGITFLEASAYGCPIAAWRAGGVAEAVLDGETGLLVEEGDTIGLANVVKRLLSDLSLRRKLGEKGQEHTRSFNWEQSARELCETDGSMPS